MGSPARKDFVAGENAVEAVFMEEKSVNMFSFRGNIFQGDLTWLGVCHGLSEKQIWFGVEYRMMFVEDLREYGVMYRENPVRLECI
jgi:hypothetical protein